MTSSAIARTTETQMILERVFDAPRDLVWETWTQLEHLEKWWGPDGFTITTSERDFREGGIWRYMMHGPDGKNYPNKTNFIKIVEPERLEYSHGSDNDVIRFEVTVTFEDLGDKTKMTMISTFPDPEQLKFVVKEFNALEGGKQHMASLAAYLETLQ